MDYNISFMVVDEADKLKEQGLPSFVEMAIRHSGGRWNETDATTYYNKIMTLAGLETETLPTPEITETNDSTGDAGATASGSEQSGGSSKRGNSRK